MATVTSAATTVLEAPDGDAFRRIVGGFLTGVTVITTTAGGEDFGMTANAVTSLSLDPPSLLVCMKRDSATCRAALEAGAFVVNVLAERQLDAALAFARPGKERFPAFAIERTEEGLPALVGSVATFACRVADVIPGSTHEVFVAEVAGAAAGEGRPLAFFRGRLGGFEPRQAPRGAAPALALDGLDGLDAELLWGPQPPR